MNYLILGGICPRILFFFLGIIKFLIGGVFFDSTANAEVPDRGLFFWNLCLKLSLVLDSAVKEAIETIKIININLTSVLILLSLILKYALKVVIFNKTIFNRKNCLTFQEVLLNNCKLFLTGIITVNQYEKIMV